MAQDYEVEDYLGPAADDRELFEAIRDCGTDDVAVWTGIVLRHDGVTTEEVARERDQARLLMEDRASMVRALTLLALHEDPDADRTALARRAGVTRQTIHNWINDVAD